MVRRKNLCVSFFVKQKQSLWSACPGSGKTTSFIKALAQHTGRSIVKMSPWPVSKQMPNSWPFSIILICCHGKDVDAASHIVKGRDGKIPMGNEWNEPKSNPNHDDDETATDFRQRQDSMTSVLWHLFMESKTTRTGKSLSNC